MEKLQNLLNEAKRYWKELSIIAIFIILTVVDCIHCAEIEELKTKVQQNGQNQKIYVYNVSRLVSSSSQIVALQQKYAQQLNDLNKQIDVAQQKLSKMKDKEAKAAQKELKKAVKDAEKADATYQKELKKAEKKYGKKAYPEVNTDIAKDKVEVKDTAKKDKNERERTKADND